MKKLLLSLAAVAGLTLSASATELELFDVTSSTAFSKTGTASTSEECLAIGGYTYQVCNVWWQKSTENSYMAFKKSTNPVGYMILPSFEDKIINSISLFLTTASGSIANAKFDIYAGETKINGDTPITWTAQGTYTDFEIPAEYKTVGTRYKIVSANTNNQIGFGKLKIDYTDYSPEDAETIELTQENFKVTAGGESVEFDEESDEAELNLWPNTEISFRYLTDNTKAELSYSYAVEAGEFVEGNSFTFTDEEDLMVQVRVTSGENSLEKNLYIYKRYPTECPKPVFNVADGAEVYAGKVITATAEGAEELDLYVNGEKVEGTSYTVAGEVGDEITLKAEASVYGKDDVLSAETEITVTVIAVPDGTFDFSTANAYGILTASDKDNTNSYNDGETSYTSGVVTMNICGSYRIWDGGSSNYSLRLVSNQNNKGLGSIEFSVPDNYILTDIEFGVGSSNTNNSTLSSGNCSNNKWVPDQLTSKVKFTRFEKNITITSATVKFALKPEVANFQHEGVKVTDKVATLDYTLAVKNHHELAKYVVTLSINDEDGKVVNTADFENHEFTYEFDFTENERPARVASQYLTATNTLVVDGLEAGTYYATVSYGLKGETPTEIALEEPVIVSSNTHETAVETVVAEGAEAVWFDLNGRRVAEPSQKGIYLVRRGNSVEKAVVK